MDGISMIVDIFVIVADIVLIAVLVKDWRR